MNNLNIGKKVEVTFSDGDKTVFTVAARNDRYVVLSDLNPTFFTYTIIDYKRKLIGQDNRIFPTGYEDFGGCRENLDKLEKGELKVSSRNSEPLSGIVIKESEAE